MRYLFVLTTLLLGLGLLTGGNYTPTDAYAVKFATAKATGTFRDLQGTIVFDADELAEANFDVSVGTATIQTGNKTQDKHARGGSWLDADQHPRISFKSHGFEATPEGYTVTGQLTIRGESRPVTIPFTFNGKVFAGQLTVTRQDYGVDGPFLFGGLVGDDVVVELVIPVTEK